jgi:spermidine synthase
LAPLLFLSGAAALILEVSWFRRTAQIAGGTAIAMGAVLAAVIGGMALGSLWIGRRADRSRNPLRLYGLLELGVALFALLTPLLLSASEGLFTLLLQRLEGLPALLTAAQFGLAALILAIPAVLMGGTLPAWRPPSARSAATGVARSAGSTRSTRSAPSPGRLPRGSCCCPPWA